MKKPANFDLRTAAKNAGVPLWAIADALHISEPTLEEVFLHYYTKEGGEP